jgi:hypothetical protein
MVCRENLQLGVFSDETPRRELLSRAHTPSRQDALRAVAGTCVDVSILRQRRADSA